MPETWFSMPLSKNARDTEGRVRNIFQGERRRPAVLVLALIAAIALLCGSVVAVRAKQSPAPPEDNREREAKKAAVAAYAAQPKEISNLPAFVYQGKEPYLAAVCDWIVNGEGTKYLQAEAAIPCPLIAEIDDSDPQDIRIWGSFNVNNYRAVGTTLLNVSGGVQPALLHLRSTKDGFEVYEVEAVEDGEGYGDSMRSIFGLLRTMKLDAVDSDTLRTQYVADYVLQNDLPFTQYQDYGWDPVHIPGTPETPEAAQHIHMVSPMGYSIDYDLREFVHDVSYDKLEQLESESLTGVGKLQGISIYFERCADTNAQAILGERERPMERPRRTETVIGADGVRATLLRDDATRDEVIKDTYVMPLNETDTLVVTVRNTYYAVQGDPVVPGADTVLEKTLGTFRLTQKSPVALEMGVTVRERERLRNDTRVFFAGEVVGYGNDTLLVRVTDMGDSSLLVGEEVYVPVAGDYRVYPRNAAVEVEYNGVIEMDDEGLLGVGGAVALRKAG